MNKLVFNKTNYLIMLAGVAVLIVGFFIMTMDKEPYGFGFIGITLGPLIVATGFGIQFWAILHKPKKA